jgi:hypothetical protein
MTTCVLIRDYACAPEGHTTLQFRMGDVISGRAAELALMDGAGFAPNEIEAPVPQELETQTIKRGRRK